MPAAKGKNRKEERKRRVVARPFWSGTISFGLINVPVQLFPAVRRHSVSLRMLDQDGTPLRRRYYCPEHERFVEADEIVRGYELEDGSFVFVEDEELEALEPAKSREIDLKRFVDLSAIPPLYFDRGYFLTPTGDSNKAYRLLAHVMERTGRAGIATFVMRGKEYLIAILAESGILRAETLRFREEIRAPEDLGLEVSDEADPDRIRDFVEAIRKIEADELDPSEMTDEYPERLRSLAERKREEGKDVVEVGAAVEEEGPDPEDPDAVEEVDLLETIRSGLRGGNGVGPGNGRRGGKRGDGRKKADREGDGRKDEGNLEDLPRNRLYERARELDIEGRSRMTRDELIRALRRR